MLDECLFLPQKWECTQNVLPESNGKKTFLLPKNHEMNVRDRAEEVGKSIVLAELIGRMGKKHFWGINNYQRELEMLCTCLNALRSCPYQYDPFQSYSKCRRYVAMERSRYSSSNGMPVPKYGNQFSLLGNSALQIRFNWGWEMKEWGEFSNSVVVRLSVVWLKKVLIEIMNSLSVLKKKLRFCDFPEQKRFS